MMNFINDFEMGTVADFVAALQNEGILHIENNQHDYMEEVCLCNAGGYGESIKHLLPMEKRWNDGRVTSASAMSGIEEKFEEAKNGTVIFCYNGRGEYYEFLLNKDKDEVRFHRYHDGEE